MSPNLSPASPRPESSAAATVLEPLRGRAWWRSASAFLIACNILVALIAFVFGAGLWHSDRVVQLAWGANFGPATKDGEWWRLGSAMFLHFGVLHLGTNMVALFDSGRLVESAFGWRRFVGVYFVSGLVGNLLSLYVHGDQAASGGASGAIFGVYGALLIYLVWHRRRLLPQDFRWMFWAASASALGMLALGVFIPGIDNAAHFGGLLAGMSAGFVLLPPLKAGVAPDLKVRLWASSVFFGVVLILFLCIPEPTYRWTDEVTARTGIQLFIAEDAKINARLRDILEEGRRAGVSFDQVAGKIETDVAEPYVQSFEQLSELDIGAKTPSAERVEILRRYAAIRRDASHELAAGLRQKNRQQVLNALEKSSRAAQGADKESRSAAVP